jgi:hypothetical protein
MSAVELDFTRRHGFTVALIHDLIRPSYTAIIVQDGEDEPQTIIVPPECARDAFEHPARYGADLCRCLQCRPPEALPTNEDGEPIEPVNPLMHA